MVETDILRENDMDSLKLALEGQQRCQRGDMLGGVWYLEAALGAGTDDLKTLSAVYSQLGNAYFVLQQYGKALEYHRHDHTLARYVVFTLIFHTAILAILEQACLSTRTAFAVEKYALHLGQILQTFPH
ncbi:G-protein-signaling modulator 2 [Trichinella papuae]|uniref:G-protein-signaling modulator 2 n=1 Tax=Trichinella papuae TaxID=268474 RepID=A0A0V1MM94_9BILA|nr:G-protein-signaling modulator 2 [Trichinella papuae]